MVIVSTDIGILLAFYYALRVLRCYHHFCDAVHFVGSCPVTSSRCFMPRQGLQKQQAARVWCPIFSSLLTGIIHARNPRNRPQSMHQTTPRFSKARLQRQPRSSRHNLHLKLSSLCGLFCTSLCGLCCANVSGTCRVLPCLAIPCRRKRLD